MTVSYHAIIRQLKKELDQLDEQSPHEHVIAKMHAVKSLADVVIHSYEDIEEKPEKSSKVVTAKNAPDMTDAEAKMMGIQNKSKQSDSRLLDDDDANGESIFDF